MTENDVAVFNGKKWVAGTRKFKSSVTHHETRGTQAYIPRPIMESWNFPDSVVFEVQGDNVVMRKAKKA